MSSSLSLSFSFLFMLLVAVAAAVLSNDVVVAEMAVVTSIAYFVFKHCSVLSFIIIGCHCYYYFVPIEWEH